jgi:hypothetical protein
MGLVLERHSSPFLIDEYIRYNSLCDFVDEFLDMANKEKEDDVMWEFYLHKVFDESFADFMNKVNNNKKADESVDFETALNESMNILDGFVPE